MKLRLLIPTRGDSPHWDAAVASVVAAAPGVEVIVVSPKPLDVPRGFRSVSDQGKGIYAALNQGLEAGGDWDAFGWLNDDDELTPGFARMWAQFQEGNAEIGYGRVDLIDGGGSRIGTLPVAAEPTDLPALLAHGVMPLAQPGMVIARRAWEKCGPFDASYRLAGDLDLFVRLIAGGARFRFFEGVVARFRLRAGQLSKDEEAARREFERAVQPLRTAKRGALGPRARFAWSNRAGYLERMRRHGFASMREIYGRTR